MIATIFLCLVVSVYDGDTFKVRCPIWPGLVAEESVRVRNLDTPEIKGKCQKEKDLAFEAKRLAQEHLKQVEISNIGRDKYGRLLADVTVTIDGKKVRWSEFLQKRGLGRPYDGGKRQSWCSNTQERQA